MRLFFLLTLWVSATLSPATAQGPSGSDPTAPPKGLQIICLDGDQGDCTILIGPTGTCMLVDAGANGIGNSRVIPALQRLGVTRITSQFPTISGLRWKQTGCRSYRAGGSHAGPPLGFCHV